jgi:cyclophilin family peptidyl-prolyl cis-trans isomerase
MTKSLPGAILALLASAALAAAQDTKTPAGKTADAKTADAKAPDAKTGDAKAADAKTADAKTADAKEPKVHEKTAAFRKLRDELTDTVKRLGKIQYDYRLVKPEGRAALEKEFEEKRAHAKKLLPQVTEAAKAAIVVDPTDAEVMDHLGALAQQAFDKRSAFEESAELAKLVLDHQPSWDNFRRPELFRIGGMSAFYTGQFDPAEKYLKQFEKPEFAGFDTFAASDARAQLKADREYWQEELKRREAEKKPEGDPQALPRVRLGTTQGDVVIELFENEAPNTVANFLALVEKKFYDGKVLETFRSELSAGKVADNEVEYKVPCEWPRSGFRRHFRGSVSMAAPQGKDTGYSQFSIWLEPIRSRDPTVKDNEITGGADTVFGRVVSGLDVLSKVRETVTSGSQSIPRIEHATVLNKRNHKYDVQKIEALKSTEKPKAEAPPKAGTPEGKTFDSKTEPAK